MNNTTMNSATVIWVPVALIRYLPRDLSAIEALKMFWSWGGRISSIYDLSTLPLGLLNACLKSLAEEPRALARRQEWEMLRMRSRHWATWFFLIGCEAVLALILLVLVFHRPIQLLIRLAKWIIVRMWQAFVRFIWFLDDCAQQAKRESEMAAERATQQRIARELLENESEEENVYLTHSAGLKYGRQELDDQEQVFDQEVVHLEEPEYETQTTTRARRRRL